MGKKKSKKIPEGAISVEDLFKEMEGKITPEEKKFMNYYDSLANFEVDYQVLFDKKYSKDFDKPNPSLGENPTYDKILEKTLLVGGELLITPMGQMVYEVPYDMQDEVAALAEKEGMKPYEWLNKVLTEKLDWIIEEKKSISN